MSARDDDVFSGDDDLDDLVLAEVMTPATTANSSKLSRPPRKRSLFDLDEAEEDRAGNDGGRENGAEAKSIFDLDGDRSLQKQQTDGPPVQVKREAGATSSLTAAQRARAERNRLKALTLKKARIMTASSRTKDDARKVVDPLTGDVKDIAKEKKVVDSGAGFFIEEDPEGEDDGGAPAVCELPPPILEPDRPACLECDEDLADSFLFRTFDLSVCDKCKDTEKDGKHELITKTDAKNTFLLKDCDLDRSDERTGRSDGNPLKFIVRKNPHNARWGDMKLYLRSQVEELALSVWGSEAALEAAHEEREGRKEKAKRKKFDKKIKELRMRVRGSLYKRSLAGDYVHEHEFGEEAYDEEEDEYVKTCKTCDFTQRYEKM